MRLTTPRSNDIVFSLDRTTIDATSERESADENWTYTDHQGHEHYYDRGYPTLTFVIDEQHWCDGTEGMYNHDPHMAIDKAHFECSQCREVIKPGTFPPGWQRVIPGTVTMTIEGTRSDGMWIRAYPSSDESEAITEAANRGDDLQPFLDAIEGDRIALQEMRG